MKKTIALVAGIFSAAVPFSIAGAENAFPRETNRLPSLPLDQLILMSLPDATTSTLNWDHMVDAPVIWLTDGYDLTPTGMAYREGIARANVFGKFPTVLKQEVHELAWTITLSTFANAKFGPDTITLEPGVPTDSCFGILNTGCDFDASVIAGSQLWDAKEACHVGGETLGTTAYWVVAPGKATSVIIHSTIGGSGGLSSLIEVVPFGDPTAVCAEIASG